MIENVFRGCNADFRLTFIYMRCGIEGSALDSFTLPYTVRIRIDENVLDPASRNMANDGIINRRPGPEMAHCVGSVLTVGSTFVFRDEAFSLHKIQTNVERQPRNRFGSSFARDRIVLPPKC